MKRSSTARVFGRWAVAGLLALGAVQLQAAQKPTLGDGLAFYAGFEQSVEADYARGAATGRGQYRVVEGVAGKGVDVQSEPPQYIQAGNLDRTAGTLAFWVRPQVDLMNDTSATTYYRDLFGAEVFKLRAFVDPSKQPRQMLCFMTGTRLPGKDFDWDYGTVVSLKEIPANRWTHLALTWNQSTGRKVIYVNGRQVAANTTKLIAPGDGGENLTLGGGLPGAYDELAVWQRELKPREIMMLAGKPAEAAAELHATAKANARQTLQWTIYPDLVYQNYADSLVQPNEPLALKLPLENRTNREQAGKITITVQDVWDKPAGEAQTFEVKLAANEKMALPFTVSASKFGAYRIAVKVQAGNTEMGRDVTTFGCLPKDPPPSHPFFGGHISQVGTLPEMGRRLGFAHNRVHNMTEFTWWLRMEPKPDDWAMEGASAYQRYMDLGYTHYGQWFLAPAWAVTLPDGKHPAEAQMSYAPTDIEALRAYVRESLKRFPAIKEWEIWNEPYVSLFWAGTPRDYVELCRVIYTEARKARPDITIYSQLYFEGPWTRDAMKLGVLNYCDAVAYHFYHHPNNDPQSAADPIHKLRALLAQAGRPDMPITASEGGMDSTTFLRGLDFADLPPEDVRPAMNYRDAARDLVQAHVVMIAGGVRAWYYYFHQPVTPDQQGLWKYINYSTVEVTRSPKPMAISRAQLAWQLDGGKFASQIKTAAGGLRAYAFERNDGHFVAVLWTEDGALAQLKVPQGFTAVDLMGNPIEQSPMEITQEPLYLHAPDLARLQAALADPSVVKSIRLPDQAPMVDGSRNTPAKMQDFHIATEVGVDKLVPLDMSAVANMSMADEAAGDGKGWMDEGPYNDLRNVKPGRHQWLGVPFVIAGKDGFEDKCVLTLKGRTFPAGPQVSAPIAVNQKLRGLFFVTAANWTEDGHTIGQYIIRYTDGQEVRLPVVVGQNIDNWWYDHKQSEESRTVWFKAADPVDSNYPYRFLRIWYWENTRPLSEVESVSVRSMSDSSTFTVAAITAVIQ